MWHRIAQRRNPVKLLQYSCIIINNKMYLHNAHLWCVLLYVFREIINLIETLYASASYDAVSVVKHVELRLLHFKIEDAGGKGDCSRARCVCRLCILFWNIMRTSTECFIWPGNQFVVLLKKRRKYSDY